MATRPGIIAAIAAASLAVLLGCSISTSSPEWVTVGERISQPVAVAAENAETARIALRMGAGELSVDGGADALLEGTFTYNVADWEPEVHYTVDESEGRLTVRQPNADQISLRSGAYNAWDLLLTDALPISLRIECGAGEQDIDLVGLNITDLDVKLGAGDSIVSVSDTPALSRIDLDVGAGSARLDLSGVWAEDAEIDIQGGVGETTVQLPKNVGVRVEVSRGIGDVDVSGLYRQGTAWVNEAYGTADVTLNIAIRAGVGRVVLEAPR